MSLTQDAVTAFKNTFRGAGPKPDIKALEPALIEEESPPTAPSLTEQSLLDVARDSADIRRSHDAILAKAHFLATLQDDLLEAFDRAYQAIEQLAESRSQSRQGRGGGEIRARGARRRGAAAGEHDGDLPSDRFGGRKATPRGQAARSLAAPDQRAACASGDGDGRSRRAGREAAQRNRTRAAPARCRRGATMTRPRPSLPPPTLSSPARSPRFRSSASAARLRNRRRAPRPGAGRARSGSRRRAGAARRGARQSRQRAEPHLRAGSAAQGPRRQVLRARAPCGARKPSVSTKR